MEFCKFLLIPISLLSHSKYISKSRHGSPLLHGWIQGSENFFVKGQLVSILGFAGHVVCAETQKQPPMNKSRNEGMLPAFDKTIFTKTSSRLEFAESRSHSFQWVNEMLPAFFSLWIFKMCSESIIYDRVLKRSLRWEFFQDKRSTSGA